MVYRFFTYRGYLFLGVLKRAIFIVVIRMFGRYVGCRLVCRSVGSGVGRRGVLNTFYFVCFLISVL